MKVSCITILVLLSFFSALAQEPITPGVSESDWNAIQASVTASLNRSFEVTDIVNVDSSIGDRAVADGLITDPYHSLSGCFIFTTIQHDNDITPHGTIGIYKNGNIVWQSSPELLNATLCTMPSILLARDLNDNGDVDIVTLWPCGLTNSIESIWIVSWNGNTGSISNAYDENKESVIKSLASGFDVVDVNGDGVFEITGDWYLDSPDGSS